MCYLIKTLSIQSSDFNCKIENLIAVLTQLTVVLSVIYLEATISYV
jgi:hypothetical protein